MRIRTRNNKNDFLFMGSGKEILFLSKVICATLPLVGDRRLIIMQEKKDEMAFQKKKKLAENSDLKMRTDTMFNPFPNHKFQTLPN